jgi:hypothetical protein
MTLAWVADDVHLAWQYSAAYHAAKPDIIETSGEKRIAFDVARID